MNKHRFGTKALGGTIFILLFLVVAFYLHGTENTTKEEGEMGEKTQDNKPHNSHVGKRPSFTFNPIGIIHSGYTRKTGAPRQGRLELEKEARIEIYSDYAEGLEGIEKFSHIIVIWVFDRSKDFSLSATPPGEKKSRGVFATRSPHRPCPIALTIVPLDRRDVDVLYVRGLEAFDGTPVLDIKPYIAEIDSFADAKSDIKIKAKE